MKRVFASLFRNPIVICIMLALVWGMGLHLPMPRFLNLSLKIFGDLGTGLALISIGMKLRPAELWADVRLCWPDAVIRLFIAPAILAAGFRLSPSQPEMVKVCVLVMAMPVAMNTFPLADAMGMDGEYAAKTIMVTTVLSVLTLPFVIRFLL